MRHTRIHAHTHVGCGEVELGVVGWIGCSSSSTPMRVPNKTPMAILLLLRVAWRWLLSVWRFVVGASFSLCCCCCCQLLFFSVLLLLLFSVRCCCHAHPFIVNARLCLFSFPLRLSHYCKLIAGFSFDSFSFCCLVLSVNLSFAFSLMTLLQCVCIAFDMYALSCHIIHRAVAWRKLKEFLLTIYPRVSHWWKSNSDYKEILFKLECVLSILI